jgi:hypothetical protein
MSRQHREHVDRLAWAGLTEPQGDFMATQQSPGADYLKLSEETIGPEDCRVTVTKWRNVRARPSSRRYLVRDASGVLIFDTDDCYDSGNALHKVVGFLTELDKKYEAEHAGA